MESICRHQTERQVSNVSFAGYLIAGTGNQNTHASVTGNIFICDVTPGNYSFVADADVSRSTENSSDTWRNNVYILLRGNGLSWFIKNNAINNGTYFGANFEDWKRHSGQDQNSLFFDLRNDPRGLRAIFTDPANGDYTLANTLEGNSIRNIRAGMVNPITCFLKRPTYEEATRIIMNDGVLSANACRNPCNRGNIRTAHTLAAGNGPRKKVILDWHINDEAAVDRYEIMRSFGNNDFAAIASLPATSSLDYAFTDSNVMAGIVYRYSVAVVTKLNEKCYSTVTMVKTDEGRPITVYPNPSTGRIMLGLNAYTGPVNVTVHNVMGRKVFAKQVNAVYGVPVLIDLSSESKGFYWLQVQTNDNSSRQGFVLQ
jgi:hypothetical protein